MRADEGRPRTPRVLTIAGTDPLSGAGVVADAITIADCGAHPLTVATALVDQDSEEVRSYELVPDPIFSKMLRAALLDGRPDAIKIGMLGSTDRGHRVAELLLAHRPGAPVVLDPVLTGGLNDAALADAATGAPWFALFGALAEGRRTLVVTPNALEIAALLGIEPAASPESLRDQAIALAARIENVWVLAKGGHVRPAGVDWLIGPGVVLRCEPVTDRWPEDVHGTGCRLSSALAVGLGRGMDPPAALAQAHAFMRASLDYATSRIGTGRPQFIPFGVHLRAPGASVTEPNPRPTGAPKERE